MRDFITHLHVHDLHRATVRRQQVLAGELDAGDRRLVDVPQLQEGTAAADIEDLHLTVVAAHRQLHPVVAETQVARLAVKDLHALKTVARTAVVALDLAVDVRHRQHLMHGRQNHLVQLRTVRGNRCHEGSLLQVQTEDLRTAAHRKQLAAFLPCEEE